MRSSLTTWLALWHLALLCLGGVAAEVSPLRNAGEIERLDADRAAMAVPVDIRGTVLQRWDNKQLIFVKSNESVLEVFTPGTNHTTQAGQLLRIEGFTIWNSGVQILARKVSVLDPASERPKPVELAVSQLPNELDHPRWIRVKGVVRQFEASRPRLWIELRDRGSLLEVSIPRPSKSQLADLQFASIEITGVLTTWERMSIGSRGRVLWTGERSDFKIIYPHRKDPFSVREPMAIEKILEIKPNALWSYRPMVAGKVTKVFADSDDFRIADATGSIHVAPLEPQPVRVGDPVQVIGFMESGSIENFLGWCEVRIQDTPGSVSPAGKTNTTVITSCSDIRQLRPNQVRRRPPVRLSGVVTFFDAARELLFIHDREAGIQVKADAYPDFLAVGQQIAVDGHAEPGRFAPVISASAIQASGVGELPAAVVGQPVGVLAGRLEASWVQLPVFVRTARLLEDEMHLRVSAHGPILEVIIKNARSLTNSLIDSLVEVQGVPTAIVNRQGQITGVRLLIPDPDRMRILNAPAEDPFTTRRTTADSLLAFQVDSNPHHIRSVEGIVTLSWPGQLFVEDATGSLEARIARGQNVRAGDRVLVAGFLAHGAERPILEDALVKVIGSDEPPAAQSVTAARILSQELNGRRVKISGVLLSKTVGVRDYTLMVEDGDITVPIVLRRRIGPLDLARFKVGCVMEATGICDLFGGHGRGARDVRLLVDSARHLAIVTPPPFWNENRLLMGAAGMAGLIVLLLLRQIMLARRMAATQSRFATAFKSSPVPVAIVTSGDFRVLDVNDSFQNQFDFQRRQLVNRPLAELGIFHDGPLLSRVGRLLAKHNAVHALDCRMRNRGGLERHTLLSVESIDIDGETCLLFIFQDVTERLALMNQLRDSQKLEAVGQLAAGVAHDFNNLLTIIRGNCDVLKDVANGDPELLEINEELDEATTRAADLTRHLLAFSRKQIMQPRILDLNIVVAGAMKMLRRLLGADIEIHSQLEGDELPVFADAGMLDQVLVNLVVNARDAMPDGGTVTIATGIRHLAEHELPQDPDAVAGDYVELSVTDTGTGMDAETLQRVFEPFFTTKEVGKGTGLGLATVHGIVKQHRGWIEVTSEVGGGTCFHVHLPLVDARTPKELATPRATAFRSGSESILVVEDEPAVRRMVTRTLERAGYAVATANNGVEARDIWRNRPQAFDLVLTDIVMPGGLSGTQLGAELRALHPDVRLVYMSGYNRDDPTGTESEVLDGAFIAKPFTKHELLTTVRNSLDEQTFTN